MARENILDLKENSQVLWDGAFEGLMWKPRPWMLEMCE